MDSCYLCELETEGLIVPFMGRQILVCSRCALEAILAHPKLAIFQQLTGASK